MKPSLPALKTHLNHYATELATTFSWYETIERLITNIRTISFVTMRQLSD